jgi:glycosyltransferase involved in cell wall biosynthesis
VGGSLRGARPRRTGESGQLSDTPDVSILLLTRNGSATLPDVLERVRAQHVDFQLEIIAIDSGSTDGTPEILQRYGARVTTIAPSEFNHGATRNRGIQQARGRYVVLLVQDAVPSDTRWLAELVKPLVIDDTLAGTYARQIPRPDASALTRFYLQDWVATSEAPRTTRIPEHDAFAALSAHKKFLTCVFDDVCSCVRRDVCARYPFKPARIAEDLEWAQAVLLAGYGIAFVPSSVVVHSHDRSARYELMRTYAVHRRLRELFGMATIPTIAALLQSIAWTIPTHLRHVRPGSPEGSRGQEMLRALGLAIALPLGQYLGARAADTGREYLRVTGV